MTISPNLSDVKRIAASGKYNVLPVSCEILSDFTTPIETMKILKNVSTHCYMLESAQANETWGRYTFLGFDPKLEITCIDGVMQAGNFKMKTDNPSDYLRQILAEYKSPRFDYLPSSTGGLVGCFTYDYLGYSEPAVRCDVENTEDFRDADLMPSPYMFYFSGTDVEVAGASPETLVKLEDGVLHTFPLAGARPRGKKRWGRQSTVSS